MIRSRSLTAATISYAPIVPGSARRSMQARLQDTIIATDRGFAPGNSATDNTSALRAIIDYLRPLNGGLIKCVRGVHDVVGGLADTEIFNAPVPIIIEGEGSGVQSGAVAGTLINPIPPTPDTCDIFKWQPSGIGFFFGLRDIAILPLDGVTGRHALSIITDASSSIEHGFIEGTWLWGGTGYGIYQFSAAPSGGTVHQLGVHHSKLTGALGGGYFDSCGDSVTFEDVGLSGTGRGLTVKVLPGAAQIVLSRINCRAMNGGAAKIINGNQVQFDHCQFEQGVVFSGTDLGLVVLDNCEHTEFNSNNLNANSVGTVDNVILMKNGTRRSVTRGGTMVRKSGGYHIAYAADCGGLNVIDGTTLFLDPAGLQEMSGTINNLSGVDQFLAPWPE